MKPISAAYKSIFDQYYSTKARTRFVAVRSYTAEFIDQYPLPEGANSGVNDVALEAFITSYFLDVIKFKEYHFRSSGPETEDDREVIHTKKMLNPSKVGALTLKWLLKFHPAYFTHPNLGTVKQRDRLNITRAPFVLAVNTSLKLTDIRVEEMPADLYRKLLYHVRFRDIDDRSLFLYFDALRSSINTKFPGGDNA